MQCFPIWVPHEKVRCSKVVFEDRKVQDFFSLQPPLAR